MHGCRHWLLSLLAMHSGNQRLSASSAKSAFNCVSSSRWKLCCCSGHRWEPCALLRVRFAARRFAQAVPLLLIISVLVFSLIHAAPGGPLSLYLDNPNVRPEDIARLRRAMGLDQPLGVQY